MCGITGILTRPGGLGGEIEAVARAMAEPLAHRGPDDSGIWADPEAGVAFGFKRLAIFDLSASGHQPMESRSGHFVIVFNGEIYNHPELRAELGAAGVAFRSGTDTEVLLEGFDRWGISETLRRARGMFAMGVWEVQARRLWLARDRLGIKPLFLYRSRGTVAFASELRAFHRIPSSTLTVDRDSVASFLELLYVPAPHSIFREVTKVSPGSLLRIDAPDAEIRPELFWSLEGAAEHGRQSRFRGSDQDAVDAMREKLREAVEIRLRADVPVGAFLSGGVDSSTVVALAQERSTQAVRTYTVAFEDARFDEGPIAADVAERLGTRHTQIAMSSGDLLDLVPRMAEVFDEPFADPSQLPTLLVSKVARRSVTVSLSGDGGDEVFAGYNRYLAGARLLRFAGCLPAWGCAALAAGLGAVPRGLLDTRLLSTVARAAGASEQHRVSSRLAKLRDALRGRTDSERYGVLLAAGGHVDDLTNGARAWRPELDNPLVPPGLSLLRLMMLADQRAYVQDDLLTKLDRASMAVSLEARVPLLDHEVLELSWALPDRMMTRGGGGKWLLREILAGFIPRSVIDRPKMGFSVPIESWLRGALRGWAQDLLSPEVVSRSGLMAPKAAWREWEFVRDNRGGNALRVWAMVMLQAWWQAWSSASAVVVGQPPAIAADKRRGS